MPCKAPDKVSEKTPHKMHRRSAEDRGGVGVDQSLLQGLAHQQDGELGGAGDQRAAPVGGVGRPRPAGSAAQG
ncbi:hypothetical protein GCM10009639_64530 [Kitasatospora putterlickiae]|uniref:Uncharacterized protein n=1 Tax=Kitasatospora putterlickiae TaxID=221725 RepID=A0ABN1YIE3_9ACTN